MQGKQHSAKRHINFKLQSSNFTLAKHESQGPVLLTRFRVRQNRFRDSGWIYRSAAGNKKSDRSLRSLFKQVRSVLCLTFSRNFGVGFAAERAYFRFVLISLHAVILYDEIQIFNSGGAEVLRLTAIRLRCSYLLLMHTLSSYKSFIFNGLWTGNILYFKYYFCHFLYKIFI